MNEQDKKAAEYLAAQGVTFAARLLGENNRDGWTCDEWRVSFQRVHLDSRLPVRDKAALETAYYTGTGHRKAVKGRKSTDPHGCFSNDAVRPVAPTAASVLYSLLQDASGADENFYDWCANYGYDTDSRKALATYEACCIIRADVNKFFTAAERAELAAILEDY